MTINRYQSTSSADDTICYSLGPRQVTVLMPKLDSPELIAGLNGFGYDFGTAFSTDIWFECEQEVLRLNSLSCWSAVVLTNLHEKQCR